MKSIFSKHFLVAALIGSIGLAVMVPDADAAKRMGGGKSVGQQSNNVSKQAPPAQAAPAAAPTAAAAPGAAAGAAGAAAPARNKWLGPLAGIAAGLGIAALLSHMGLGGAMADLLMNFLMIGALVMAGLFAYRMWRNRSNPPLAAAGGPGAMPARNDGAANPVATERTSLAGQAMGGIAPALAGSPAALAGSPAAMTNPNDGSWTLPAGFDVEDFKHIAKMYFVRMQAAWDAGDEQDIRNFTTPEMFGVIKLDLMGRTEATHTDVVTLDAQVLGVEVKGETTMASVRMSGTIRESKDGAAEAFKEVWNLEKPTSARASWVLAGIQQETEAT